MSKKIIFPLLILALVFVGWAFSTSPSLQSLGVPNSFTLAVASDIHYLSPDLTDNGEYFLRMVENSDAKAMEHIEEIADGLTEAIIKKKPGALILSGDLTFNGETQSHLDLASKLCAIEEAGIPVLVIPGNHDLYSDQAASFQGDSYTFVDSPSAEKFAEIYSSFGYDEALSRDPASLSYTYELTPKLWALMLDVNTKQAPGALKKETLEWAKSQVKAAEEAGAYILASSHQNLLAHNSLFSYGYVIESRDQLYSLYKEAGVLFNLSGHMHIQHIVENEDGVIDIATSALSVAPCQYGILDIYTGGIDYHTEQIQFPHLQDVIQLMRDRSYKSIEKRIPNASDEEKEFYVDVNSSYFSGRNDLVKWNQEIYESLLKGLSFSGLYLQTVYEDGMQNHAQRHFDRDDLVLE